MRCPLREYNGKNLKPGTVLAMLRIPVHALRGLLVAIIVFAGHGITRAGDLKVGAATADITPPPGMPMWGYAARHDAPAVGVRDRLQARCVVLDDGSTKFAIVSLDLGRPPTRNSMARIRERLAPLSLNHIWLVASHTHHGPVLELDDLPDPQNPYNRILENTLVDLIKKCTQNLMPARLGVAARETGLNRNRHSKRPDTPVDKTLTVVRVESTTGKPVATLVNFAAHPTMLDSKLLEYSADWPGEMARRIEQQTSAPCLFLQGCSGDLTANPPRKGTPADFGESLADETLALWKTVTWEPSIGPLRAARAEMQFRCALDIGNPLVRLALGRAFFPKLVDHYEAEYRTGVRPELSAGLLSDRIGIVGFSGEMFSGHALSLRRRARMDHLIICGLCNDYQQYFPTIEAMSEGGYGSTLPVAVSEPGAGEKLTDRALIELYRLRGKLP
ncbi:MAG: neutral/alkaline non-lysosomal ceramidase N-terminal domain-containing protein [Gemmataceae bacterium]|nr:neutral/alkaline non-lysosomal ceramidase N-terminal domain-containing protein [Gemmataceae bacterium]